MAALPTQLFARRERSARCTPNCSSRRRASRPAARGCCFCPGSTARVRRRPTATCAADIQSDAATPGGPGRAGRAGGDGVQSPLAVAARRAVRRQTVRVATVRGWGGRVRLVVPDLRRHPRTAHSPHRVSPGWQRSAGRRCTRCCRWAFAGGTRFRPWCPFPASLSPIRANRKTYEELFSAFVACYKRTRGLFTRLNRRRNDEQESCHGHDNRRACRRSGRHDRPDDASVSRQDGRVHAAAGNRARRAATCWEPWRSCGRRKRQVEKRFRVGGGL